MSFKGFAEKRKELKNFLKSSNIQYTKVEVHRSDSYTIIINSENVSNTIKEYIQLFRIKFKKPQFRINSSLRKDGSLKIEIFKLII